MLAYGLDADAAFALMCWQSQHANIKLRDLADRLVTAVGGDGHIPAGIRQSLDEIVYSLPEAAQAAPVPESGTGSATGVLGVLQDVQVDGAVVLRISGEIDMATGPRLDSSLAAAVAAAAAPAPVVVDLTGVRHLGSVGVALLTSYHRRCHLAGTPLRVVAGSGPPAGVLSVTHTGLDVYQSLPDALAAPVSEPSGPPSLRPERHHGD
jgi:anti-anti-sigma factor